MLRIAGIIDESVVDGEGWRYTIFFQGCIHKCEQCQNPQTWDINGGEQIYPDDLLSKVNEAFNSNPLLDGVTLSGGDPFIQNKEDIIYVCKELKKSGINIWAYTGYTFEQILANENLMDIAKSVDVIVDGKFDISQKTLEKRYVGSRNQRIIDVKQSIKSLKAIELKLE